MGIWKHTETRYLGGKRWDRTCKTAERKNPRSTEEGKVKKTQFLASRSFSNEKIFRERGRA